MRQTKEIIVLDIDDTSPDWPPSEAQKFLDWLNMKLELIPYEHRETAIIDINGMEGEWGSYCAELTISYTRPETDEEMHLRESEEPYRWETSTERARRLQKQP